MFASNGKTYYPDHRYDSNVKSEPIKDLIKKLVKGITIDMNKLMDKTDGGNRGLNQEDRLRYNELYKAREYYKKYIAEFNKKTFIELLSDEDMYFDEMGMKTNDLEYYLFDYVDYIESIEDDFLKEKEFCGLLDFLKETFIAYKENNNIFYKIILLMWDSRVIPNIRDLYKMIVDYVLENRDTVSKFNYNEVITLICATSTIEDINTLQLLLEKLPDDDGAATRRTKRLAENTLQRLLKEKG